MITKILLAVLTLVACWFAGDWLAQNNGSVQITWLGYVVETSVSFCVLILLVAILIVYLILFPFRWLDRVRSFFHKREEEKAQLLMGQILTNIFCQEPQKNTKLFKALEKTGKVSKGVLLILKAQSIQNKEIFTDLTHNSVTEQIGWRGLISYYISRGETVKACEETEELLKKDAKQPWLLKQAIDLFVLTGQWQHAYDCLEKLSKSNQITKKEYLYKKANLLVKLGKGKEAFDTCPELPQAALLAATQNPKKAESIFIKAWEACPSWAVYRAYMNLFVKENTLAQFKRMDKLCMANKNAKLNDLVRADAAINAKLWSEAKRLVNGYMATNPLTMGVAMQVAIIESEANHDMKEAQRWIEKAATALPDTEYVCTKCGHTTNVWAETCPACKEFAGLKVK